MGKPMATKYDIPFNKPFIAGKELEYIKEAVGAGKLSGNGVFTKRCQGWFERRYGFGKCLLTTSCTDALEMAAMLCGVGPGDEVIMPSYTFVSTALAFVRQGAKVVFVDSGAQHPNLDASRVEALVTERTKVIVPVHYAGCACDMDAIMDIARRHGLRVVEDAAQAVDSWHVGKDGKRRALGSIGDLGCFSFHETKNIIAGEGGMLAVNDPELARRAEIIWEKGTNRAEFFRGEVNKYGWVDVGSSFLPSELTAAFLWGQLEHLDAIQAKRRRMWEVYMEELEGQGGGAFETPVIPPWATNNGHCFYLTCRDLETRSRLIAHLKENGVLAVFHYLPLHSSPFFKDKHDGRALPNCDRYADTLVRLPLYYDLTEEDARRVARLVVESLGG
jgi:dTDP-4-amino-4,6-dideoxygalactose transaminase